MQRQLLSLAFVSLTLGAAACAHDDKPTETPSTPPTTTATTPPPAVSTTTLDTAPADPQMQTATHPSTVTPPAPPPPLTDPQIAAITDAANSGEVDQAKLALIKTTDAKVKQFAQMMVSHHSDAKSQQGQLLSKIKVTPEANATSDALTKSGSEALEQLKAKTGAEFDRAYVDLQVKEHRDVLTLLDEKILPAVANADFKKALTGVRGKVAMHLTAAETLQQGLRDKTKAP